MDNICWVFHHSNFVLIQGQREREEPVTLSKVEKIAEVLTENSELCKVDKDLAKVAIEKELIQNLTSSKKSPDERLRLQKCSHTYIGNALAAEALIAKPLAICEEVGESWLPRVQVIELAHTMRDIFALSIVPFDPDVKQTWYYKKSISILEYTQETKEEIGRKYHFWPGLPEASSEDWHQDKISCKITGQEVPSEVYTGFFKPFETFSCEKAGPQFDPEKLPDSLAKACAFYEYEVDSALSEINNTELQETVRKIVSFFIDDEHAKGLGLTLLQAPLGKTFYFTKTQ